MPFFKLQSLRKLKRAKSVHKGPAPPKYEECVPADPPPAYEPIDWSKLDGPNEGGE